MHPPMPERLLPFPVVFKRYLVAGWVATPEEMRAAFGPAHYVEIDSTRTFGGNEDCWAWELASGQRIMVTLEDRRVTLYCDSPNARAALEALEVVQCEPHLHPGYGGPA